jgi:hypothetical protein
LDTLEDLIEWSAPTPTPDSKGGSGGVLPARHPTAKRESARHALATVDPEAQVQWFTRSSLLPPPTPRMAMPPELDVDIDVSWEEVSLDEESDTEPTLVLRRRAKS